MERSMKKLSDRTAGFTDSVIRRMTRISNRYGAINLSQGFPDFDPPREITERLREVAEEGPHQYALTFGAKNFRDALSEKQEHFSGMKIDPETEILRKHESHDGGNDDHCESGGSGCCFLAFL